MTQTIITNTGDASQFVPMKTLMAAFADPVVMLFLGGFVLAIVAAKYGMDVTMARILLKPFGKNLRPCSWVCFRRNSWTRTRILLGYEVLPFQLMPDFSFEKRTKVNGSAISAIVALTGRYIPKLQYSTTT